MADPTGSGSNGGTTTVVSNPPNLPTTNTVPNTTTDTTTVQYQSAISNPTGVLAAEDAQLPRSTLIPSSVFGFGNLTTNLPSIDNALGTIRSLFSGTTGSLASNTTLNAAQADAYYTGTGTLTAEQRLAQDQQTAADAARLYPGSNNEALRQIDIGAGRIVENEVGIAAAEQIIARNTAELADPFISDARRLELEANNEAQYEYIQVATENIAIQENVIEQNANVYAAGGGNPDSGQAPAEVAALEDPGLDTATQTNIISAKNANDINAAEDAALAEDEAFENLRVGPTDPFGVLAAEDAALAEDEAAAFENLRVGPADPFGVLAAEDAALAEDEAAAFENLRVGPTDPFGVLAAEDAALAEDEAAAFGPTTFGGFAGLVDQEQGSQEAAIRSKAQKQATIQARYKQPGNTDWRVRLSLGPGAKYLYNAEDPGILAPLKAGSGTDGVIFPYTPNITTTYSANYEQYDLVHSNYRGLFYKNSRVGDIQIRGTFTAQNTTEANYLLAVIHFFRSATKMFYGQDPQRGTPPPICLLNGFGGFQFSDHPVVISAFNYTLPNDVDYIRTTNPNNFGLDLNNRYNPSGASLPAGGSLAGLTRLANALLPKGAQPLPLSPNTVTGSVTNNTPASYVPTKMEIDITLIPAQTRSQVSKQFSLAGFANGALLKGGFW